MKKTILALCLSTLMTVSYAQNKASFGLKGGVNLSNISKANLETKTGFNLSMFANIQFTELYALQPELGYSLQGGQSDGYSEADMDIHYISVAVANKFFIKDSGLHFIVAPGLDFDADDTLVGLYNDADGNDVTFVDLTFAFGLGYEFDNGLGFEARYKQGTIDVFSDAFNSFDSDLLSRETQLNSTFQIGVFYKFKF
ncbi:PorT family protein [Tamlana haliotis]|uniref:PorT family protein n=1 Tax=Pseudotamlana haliotis TaxID=2614804 RepID=A0A6N6ML72_9FLAO|nr:outer membrane beta-barrel protein [Tamlana haliotis]KAB1069027.1 PorT family protein [Tamlana haliotis]